jgi:Yip1-like protein
MTEPQAISQPAQASKASLWEDFIDVLYAPADVFRRRENGNWFVPMLVVTLIMTAIAYFTFDTLRGAYQPLIDKQMEAISQRPGFTPDMAAATEQRLPLAYKLGPLIGIPLLIFVVALVMWLTGKAFGSRQTFRAAMVVTGYAQVTRVIASLLLAVQALVLDPSKVTSLFALSIGPARFVSPKTISPVALAILTRLDVFTIWATVLLGVGVYATGKLSKRSATAVAVIVWLLGSLPAIRSAILTGSPM